jgi:hypothetical protein
VGGIVTGYDNSGVVPGYILARIQSDQVRRVVEAKLGALPEVSDANWQKFAEWFYDETPCLDCPHRTGWHLPDDGRPCYGDGCGCAHLRVA